MKEWRKYLVDYLTLVNSNKLYKPFTELGIINAPCAIGKTTAAKGALQKYFGMLTNQTINKDDSVMITFRSISRKQLLNNGGFENLMNPNAFGEPRVPIVAGQVLGELLIGNRRFRDNEHLNELVANGRKLVILDELHCLSEGHFAFSLNALLELIERWVNDPNIIVIALDATETFLRDYLFNRNKNYTNISLDYVLNTQIEPVNIPSEIVIYRKSSLGTVLKLESLDERIDKNNRALVLTSSNDKAYKLSKEYLNAAFICSVNESNRSIIKIEENGEEVKRYAKDLCDRECLYSIQNDKVFPDDVNIVFASIALQEAAEIKDSRVKYFYTDKFDEIGIVQGMARIRTQIERVSIINDGRGIENNKKDKRILIEVYEYNNRFKGWTQKELKGYYEEYVKQQEKLNNPDNPLSLKDLEDIEIVPPLVYLDNGIYRINKLAIAEARYILDNVNSVKDNMEEHYEKILARYPQNIIKPIVEDAQQTKYGKKYVKEHNSKREKEIELDDLEDWIDVDINYTLDKESVKRLQDCIGIIVNRRQDTRPLAWYRKGEGKKLLSSIGLEMARKDQVPVKVNGKTKRCIVYKVQKIDT